MFQQARFDDINFARSGDCFSTSIKDFTNIINQRLEQGDTDIDNIYGIAQLDAEGTMASNITSSATADILGAGEKLISAFQQTFFSIGNVGNVLSTVGVTGFEGNASVTRQAQTVERHMEGYFYSCLNCNVGEEHSFSAPAKLAMQSQLVDNPTITSIVHTRQAVQTNRRTGALVTGDGLTIPWF